MNNRKTNAVSPPLNTVEDEEYTEVEDILDNKIHYGILQYLVKCLRFPVTDNKWLKSECQGTTEEYFTDYPEKYFEKPSPNNPHREKRLQCEKRKK